MLIKQSDNAATPRNGKFLPINLSHTLPSQGTATHFGKKFVAGVLGYKSNAVNRNVPTLHDSITPSFHLISLFARARRFGSMVTPICFAVFRFTTSSNLIGCSTAR